MGEGGPCLFMSGLAMYNDGIVLFVDLGRPVPYFFYKRAGLIVFFGLNPDRAQFFFNFQGGPKGRDDHNIFCAELFEWNELPAVSVLEKSNTSGLKVRIYLGIMDHFA